ncbi:MAG: carboxypeptidase-like regulatory domain-containing protein [Polyangiaceae bacterium]
MNKTKLAVTSSLAIGIIAVAACGSSKSGSNFQGTPDAGGGLGTGQLGDDGGLSGLTSTLTGTVLAPEGTIPIAGALVYFTDQTPDPIPDGTYCDKCVSLPDGTYTTTGSDGTFSLPAPQGHFNLVVQKGQFRRVRPIDTVGGPQKVDKTMTTLPGKMDKANGDDIPKMALIDADYDKIDESLGKLGLAGAFDEYSEGAGGANSQEALLSDPAKLAQYHFVFRGCSSCDDGYSSKGAYIKNLQDYVKAGGKLYVTDWSYEYVHQGWPQYLDFETDGETGFGGGCIGEYDAPATTIDPGMKDWLGAQSITSFSTEGNWSIITKVNSVNTTDADGNPTVVTPHVWIAGTSPDGETPNTVSFEDGCGRVLFSTYHTEGTTGGGSTDFLPQEKALMYVLLEVSVCSTNGGPPR